MDQYEALLDDLNLATVERTQAYAQRARLMKGNRDWWLLDDEDVFRRVDRAEEAVEHAHEALWERYGIADPIPRAVVVAENDEAIVFGHRLATHSLVVIEDRRSGRKRKAPLPSTVLGPHFVESLRAIVPADLYPVIKAWAEKSLSEPTS